MNIDRKVVEQALEGLEAMTFQLSFRAGYEQGRFDAQVEAAQQQEPVAWRYKKEGGGWFVSDNEPQYVEQWNDIEEIQPLYTTPPASKPWVGLTDEEINEFFEGMEPNNGFWLSFARAIEAKLRGKNA